MADPIETGGKDKLLAAYRQAKDKHAFLKAHPNFAANHPELSTVGGTGGPKIQKSVAGDIAAGQAVAHQNIEQQNPDFVTDFGSQTVTYDDQGNPIVTQTMDPKQKELLEGQQQLHATGTATAQNMADAYQSFSAEGRAGQVPEYQNTAGAIPDYTNQAGAVQPFDPSVQHLGQFQGGQGAAGVSNQQVENFQDFQFDSGDTRQRVEGAAYDKLTQNLERDRGREIDAKKQELYNKGIPYSDDPNSRWQKEMGDINQRYDDRSLAAGRESVLMGGQEMSRDFGVQRGAHQQGMSDMSTMFSMAKDTHVTQEQTDKAQFAIEQMTSQQKAYLQQQAHSQGITDAEMFAKLQQQAHSQGVTDTQLMAQLQQQDFNQQAFEHQQWMSDQASFSNIGTGAIMPNLPGYNAPPPVDATSPSQMRVALKKLGLDEKQINNILKAAEISANASITSSKISADAAKEVAKEKNDQPDEGAM